MINPEMPNTTQEQAIDILSRDDTQPDLLALDLNGVVGSDPSGLDAEFYENNQQDEVKEN